MLNPVKLFYKLLNSVAATSDELPKLRYHVADQVINFHDNYVCAVIGFDGVVYESISDNTLESDYDNLNRVYTEAAREKAGRLAFHCYQLRRKIEVNTTYDFNNKFCQDFANKYLQRFNDKDYYENKFYISVLLKFNESVDEAVDELESIVESIVMKLQKYEPHILTAYINDKNILCSEIYEFFFEILNSEKSLGGYPITGTPLYDTLPSSSLHFGYEVMQSKGAVKNRFATMFDLKDFPASTHLGMFNTASLALPFEYNLVQSFTALAPTNALRRIEDQLNRLRSTSDRAEHQQKEMREAQGRIQAGELSFGQYHAALIVYGDTPQEAVQNGIYAMASFSNNAGAIFRKATVSAPATYFSQFPRYKYIPRKMIKSSRNLAGTFSMHTYSRGKSKGNPLGDGSAIMPISTRAGTLYDFNFHFTNPLEDTVGDEIAGHTLILGETGAGKTTLQMAMTAFVSRFNPAMFMLDKSRGMEIFVRAMDGDYFAIEEGKPTGINPFQFPDSPKLREFLNNLIITCANDEHVKCSSEEQNQIKQAVDAVMAHPIVSERRFSRLLEAIPNRGGKELAQRLRKWCHNDKTDETGRLAWALDNPTNQFDPNTFKIVGFEVGDILKPNKQVTEPLLACLFYLKSEMVKRYKLIMTVVEEFWLPLKYPTTEAMIEEILKDGRKRGEFIMLVTQSPAEALKSKIFDAIIQQTPTKILLPNTEAEYENEQGTGYGRIGLTRKEFEQLKTLSKDSRTFLVKQGHQSSFGVLNLYGFANEIAVLSGNKKNVELLDELMKHLPEKTPSEVWLPLFYEALRLRKLGKLPMKAETVPDFRGFMHSEFVANHLNQFELIDLDEQQLSDSDVVYAPVLDDEPTIGNTDTNQPTEYEATV